MKIDLMSMSGHKIYGPKGVGALYIRRRPRVRLTPLIDGGGQERGVRSGTLPTPLCVGFGKACTIAGGEMAAEAARLKDLRERLRASLQQRVPGLQINGDLVRRLPGSLNVSVPGTTAPDLIEACQSIAISTGSACTSASVEPSYVLRALGLSDERSNASIRLGLGRFTTDADVDYAADTVAAAAAHLRQGKMMQSGETKPT
jgi:cysteine desulfurase